MKNDAPWIPTSCPLAGYYARLTPNNSSRRYNAHNPVGNTIEDSLVANSVRGYEQIVTRLSGSKEAVYDIRVKILEAIDNKIDHQYWSQQMNKDKELGKETGSTGTTSTMMNDVERFLLAVSREW